LAKNATHASEKAIRLLQSSEFSSMIDSGMLEPGTLALVGQMGRAMAETRSAQNGQLGLFGMLGAMRDPQVQRTLDFAMRFAKELGRQLDGADEASPKLLTP
jgi:uncharacterized protein YjgD (DUF1641 family)